jgi:hypothetical protein
VNVRRDDRSSPLDVVETDQLTLLARLWACQGSNLGPANYEFAALATELQALGAATRELAHAGAATTGLYGEAIQGRS